jgi:hypothetical protein
LDPPGKPPVAQHLSDAEWRRPSAEALYESAKMMMEEGNPTPPSSTTTSTNSSALGTDASPSLGSGPTGGLLRERGRMDEEL